MNSPNKFTTTTFALRFTNRPRVAAKVGISGPVPVGSLTTVMAPTSIEEIAIWKERGFIVPYSGHEILKPWEFPELFLLLGGIKQSHGWEKMNRISEFKEFMAELIRMESV